MNSNSPDIFEDVYECVTIFVYYANKSKCVLMIVSKF